MSKKKKKEKSCPLCQVSEEALEVLKKGKVKKNNNNEQKNN